MERYLTPIEYEQYLHDKAYQTAIAHTFPTVTQVFVVVGIFIIAVLVWAVMDKRRKKRRQAGALRREVMRHELLQSVANNSKALSQKEDAKWFKAHGSVR